ncbi:glycosyltransferase family 2 protein [Saccharicrinis sp. FJH54]|uniref:glycosyltransferase family 2 protein n=1 Tax=Saccharicrinis sp. FJH54 TaxID=3344665 RepID=UPI0035D3E9DF
MPEISTVIITHNEAKNIERCLASVKPVSNEIIVVDSFSTDTTPDICRSHPEVSFYQREFTSHGDQKNFGISMTNNDYILSLDADESLSPELLNHMVMNRDQFTAFAYSFRRLNHIGSEPIKHGLWYPDEKVRLFRKDKARWETGVLHEKLVTDANVRVVRIPLHINHFGFNGIKDFREKSFGYARWWADNKFKAGEKTGVLSPLFHALWTFIRSFFIKLAFLDGTTGVQISVQNTRETYLKYKTLRLLHKHG